MPERIDDEQDLNMNLNSLYSHAIAQKELKCQLKSFPIIIIQSSGLSQKEIP